MSCPVCAGPCQCAPVTLQPVAEEQVAVLVDPENYDPSEEQFAASFSELAQAEVVKIREAPPEATAPLRRTFTREAKSGAPAVAAALALKDPRAAASEAPEWKDEVSSRVSRYRSRRRSRSEHRSLVLNFEAPAQPEPKKEEAAPVPAESEPEKLLDVHDDLYGLQRDGMVPPPRAAMPVWRKLLAMRQAQEQQLDVAEAPVSDSISQEEIAGFTGNTLSQLTETVRAIEMKNCVEIGEAEAKVIEFPRPAETETLVELAEPVVPPAPRIFEAEDVEIAAQEHEAQAAVAAAPPIPTITLESLPVGELEDPAFELPLPVAPVTLRWFGLGFDLAIVAAGCTLFAATLFAMHSVPEDRSAFVLAMLVSSAAWCFYQCLFLIREGNTPGMRVAGLKLVAFEEQPITRRELKLRAWSVMLSSISLGLGFAWALLDEDRLCWHDRISRTCTTIG